VEVVSIVPAGSDPHSFEPSLEDRAQMDSAQLLISNGLRLEAGITDTLEASAQAGATLIALGPLMDPIKGDPHVWLDPIRVAAVLPELTEAIVAATGIDSQRARACSESYQNELLRLNEDLGSLLGEVPAAQRKLVTNHDSLAYFAARYEFEVLGSIIPSTSGLGEASPADLETLARLIEAEEVRAVFTESQSSDDVARALAEQLPGVSLIELDTGSLADDGSGPADYIELMRQNAELIAQGLS
jgi:zinc/manganese transport system substrate-binding protein